MLLSDIVLKGKMHGLELAHRLSTVRPDTKVLFMSGYSDALNRAGVSTETRPLEEPSTNAELRERVRKELEGMAEAHVGLPLRASGSDTRP